MKNLKLCEVNENGVVLRNGYNLGRFVVKDGIYHFVDSVCNGGGQYYHSIDTGCTNLADAVCFISE